MIKDGFSFQGTQHGAEISFSNYLYDPSPHGTETSVVSSDA